MALTTTTAGGAQGVSDKFLTVASATGFAAGMFIKVDAEVEQVTKEYVSGTSIPVLRGLNGTNQVAHVSGTNVTVGLATDFPDPAPGGPATVFPAQRAEVIKYYAATGALELPAAGTNGLAVLNGTVACLMTLAVPNKLSDGTRLVVVGNGKAAHTITLATAIGNAGSGYTVLTFAAGGQVGVEFIAVNGIWCCLNAVPIASTITNLLATIS
jgi:hypothetical protein